LSLDAKKDWLGFVQRAWQAGELNRITLAGPRTADKSLRQVTIRPVAIKERTVLSFVYRHATKDVTKNLEPDEGFALVEDLVGRLFAHGYLQTPKGVAHLDYPSHRPARIRYERPAENAGSAPEAGAHDRTKQRHIEATVPWLQALGVTAAGGSVFRGMEAKFRQIHRFVELLAHLLPSAKFAAAEPLRIADMGCGKGYLTFAACEHFRRIHGGQLRVLGIESRPELVELTNRVAELCGFAELRFMAGTIADTELDRTDVLIALHACDTATDDAVAKGIAAGARLLVVAPCCHKQIRPQLVPPPVLEVGLRHGILLQREADFVTDALRAALLEWAGYETQVMEFIAPEHTSKNLMITAVKRNGRLDCEAAARRVRELAAFYGIREQQLATHLGFALGGPAPAPPAA
jgi:SAM-dependent methyltransferase